MMRSLYISSTGLGAQQLSVEVISNNLANVSTIGFKRSRHEFQDLFYQTIKSAGTNTGITLLPVGIQIGSGVRPVTVHRTFEQGDFEPTGRQFDIAIEGEGFFQVSLPDGSIAYTRAGSFKPDNEGAVLTSEGLPLLPAIVIPPETKTINVSRSGLVSIELPGNPIPAVIGQVELARFINPSGLSSLGKNLYQPTAASGAAVVGLPGLENFGATLQGYIERSNVNIAEEMVNMIVAQRAYELNARAIQTSDEMLAVVNTLKR